MLLGACEKKKFRIRTASISDQERTGVLHGQGEVTSYTKQSEEGNAMGSRVSRMTQQSSLEDKEEHSAVTQNGGCQFIKYIHHMLFSTLCLK